MCPVEESSVGESSVERSSVERSSARAGRRDRRWLRVRAPAVAGASRAVTLIALIALVGLLPWLGGRDPALAVLRAASAEREPTPEALAAVRADLGLEAGPLGTLAHWTSGALSGDLGLSWVTGRPVLPEVLAALRVSAALTGFAVIVALLVAAVITAPVIWQGLAGPPRQPAGRAATALVALPEFLLAELILAVVAVQLHWAPPYGWAGPEYAVLPALALGLPAGGLLGGLVSDALALVFAEPWVNTWRVAGFSRPRIIGGALRRAVPSLAGQVALVAVGLIGGAVAVEQVFAVPGLGRATLTAAASGDLPALQAGILVLLAVAVLAGVAATAARTAALGAARRTGSIPAPSPSATATATAVARVPALAAGVLALVLLAGLPRDPYRSTLGRLQAPDVAHPLGSDAVGRDLLARLAHGAGLTIGVAVTVTALCLLVGLLAGLLPAVMTGPIEVANALPPVIAGMIVAGVSGPSHWGAAVAIALVGWAPLASHTAALVIQARATPYAQLAPVLGIGPWRLLRRDILPGLVGPVTRHAVLRLPGNALALAGLGFLGLGSPPPAPEWGAILAEGMPYLERAPWAVLAPTLALVLLAVTAQASSGSGRSWQIRSWQIRPWQIRPSPDGRRAVSGEPSSQCRA